MVNKGIEVSKEEMLDYLLRSAKGYSPALVKYAYYLENGIYVEKKIIRWLMNIIY